MAKASYVKLPSCYFSRPNTEYSNARRRQSAASLAWTWWVCGVSHLCSDLRQESGPPDTWAHEPQGSPVLLADQLLNLSRSDLPYLTSCLLAKVRQYKAQEENLKSQWWIEFKIRVAPVLAAPIWGKDKPYNCQLLVLTVEGHGSLSIIYLYKTTHAVVLP